MLHFIVVAVAAMQWLCASNAFVIIIVPPHTHTHQRTETRTRKGRGRPCQQLQ